ncbi:unnamed protein product, partial [Iphiclides podalirius]
MMRPRTRGIDGGLPDGVRGRVVNALGRGANVCRRGRGGGGAGGRRRGESEAAIDEARTRLAHSAPRAHRPFNRRSLYAENRTTAPRQRAKL